MKPMHSAVSCGFGIAMLSGCYSVTGSDTQRTTPAGDLNFGVGLEHSMVSRRNDGFVSPRLAGAYGVTDRVEVGAELALLHAKAQARMQLVRDDVEVTVGTGLMLGVDDDFTFYDDGPPRTRYAVSRSTVHVGTDADELISAFIAPMFDIGYRRIGAFTRSADVIAPGVRAGIVFALVPNATRLSLEAGYSHHLGLPGRFDGSELPGWQTDLGYRDRRVGFYLGLIFGPYRRDPQ